MTRAPRPRRIVIAALAVLTLATTCISLIAHAMDDSDRRRAMAATIQIQAVISAPDYKAPWQCRPTESVSGSGVLLEGGVILTSAHVVAQAVSVELRRQGLADRYPAHVTFIDHSSDLALLQADDPRFAANVEPLPLGDMPRTGDAVNVYGYPLEAQSVCSTEGVISRVEYAIYSHGLNNLLMAQMDAAINPGSSGGPAVAGGKIVGLAMQKPEEAEAASQFIPTPVIRRFLKDITDGRVDGVPALGATVQALENESLRESLGLRDGQTGVLLSTVAATGTAAGVLAPDDVILAIDGMPVANDATVALEGGQRVDFDWPLQRRQVGDRLPITWLRAGAVMNGDLVLKAGGALLDGPTFPTRAPYRIFGGLVFQPVDLDLALSMPNEVPNNIITIWEKSLVQTAACRQRVRLCRVLPNAVNRGFELWGGEIVTSVQGVQVRDFAHLNELLDGLGGRWARIDLDDDTRIVLDLPASRSALPTILKAFNIAADRHPAPEGVAVAANTVQP